MRIGTRSACTANIRQDRTGSPPTMTVQAPHTPCSQPRWVPVWPQFSRIASASVRRGSTLMAWSRPLMLRVMSTLPVMRASPSLGAALAQSRADFPRRCRDFVDRDVERRQRIVDGVDHGRRRADRAAFADALGLGDGGVAIGFHVMQLDRRDFARGRQQVVGERAGENVAGVAVDDFLQQRIADALGDAAMDLAVRDHRIDDAAGVFRHQELLDRHVAGVDVDQRRSQHDTHWRRCRPDRRRRFRSAQARSRP